MSSRRLLCLSAVPALVATLMTWACVGTSPLEPTPPPADLPDVSIALRQDVDLVAKQTVRLRDTNIGATLVEARGPRDGCFDCPLSARLTARSGNETIELAYSFSGNMPPELLERAKRKTAFGHVFVAVRIVNDNLRLRVERAESE